MSVISEINFFNNKWAGFAVLILLWVLIYLPGLGYLEFKGEEARRVMPAQTMLETGNYMLPYVCGEPYYNKPPMMNWLIAASFKLTGVQSEFTARLVSVIAILFFIGVLYFMPGLLNQKGRFLSAAVFLTIFGLFEKGRLIEIEAVFVCLTGLAVLWWVNLEALNRYAWLKWIGASFFLTAGTMTKGPVILLFFYLPIICILFYSKNLKSLLHPGHIVGLVVLFALPWLWANEIKQMGLVEEMAGQMGDQFFSRIFNSYNPKYLLKVFLKSLKNFLPWLLFAPILWDRQFTSKIVLKKQPVFKGLRTGMVICFVLISLMPGNESRYTMPLLPIFAMLLGWVLTHHDKFAKSEQIWKAVILNGFGVAVVSIVAAIIAVGVIKPHFAVEGVVVLIIIAITTFMMFKIRNTINNVPLLTISTALLVMVFVIQFSVIAPHFAVEKRRSLAAKFNNITGKQPLYVYKPGFQAFYYYVDNPIFLTEPDQLNNDVQYLLIFEKQYQQIKDTPQFANKDKHILEESDYWIYGSYRFFRMDND